MSKSSEAARPLAALTPAHEFFVGIDSDGCVFDTMEVKHKECFCPNYIKHFGLAAVSNFARQSFEFVNLYSKWRGINRWPALTMSLDLTRERAEVLQRGFRVPELPEVRKFIESGLPLSNDGLTEYMKKHPHPELERALAWSKGVNETVGQIVKHVPPFPYVRESFQKLQALADVIVVSATPGEALVREWEEHNVARYARVIAGQEMGTKQEHLKIAAAGKYRKDRILMMGDAPGDLKAARSIDALFFPINPGREDASWQLFHDQAFDKFRNGEYAGAYETKLIEDFQKLLPEVPPWKRK